MSQMPTPGVVGLPTSIAEALLRSAGFLMVPKAAYGTNATVQSQSPPAGTSMEVGSVVTVILSFKALGQRNSI